MEKFKNAVRNMCFGKEVENRLLNAITETTTEEDFVFMVRKYDECFNGCYHCANDLESHEDGYLTTHGTCDECVNSDEED